MYSMTGYGAATGKAGQVEISVTAKSFNHRYLEVKPRLPSQYYPCEIDIKKTAGKYLTRGTIDIYIERKISADENAEDTGGKYIFHSDRAKELIAISRELNNEWAIGGGLTVGEIMARDEILSFEEETKIPTEEYDTLMSTLETALENFNKSRKKEGAELFKHIEKRISAIKKNINEAIPLMDASRETYKNRLLERVKEVAGTQGVDQNRLHMEIAIMFDRLDVSEEIDRALIHLDSLMNDIASDEKPLGKKLDFTVQEIMREVTTISNKANAAEVSKLMITVKNEIERIREQIQNVE